MTLRFNDKAARHDVRKNSRSLTKAVWSSAVFACLSAAAVFGAASPLYAQGNDGSAKVRVIKPFIGYEETFQWSDVPEIISEGAKDSKDASALDYAWASDLFFEKEIWQLQFAYKNLRTIDVQFPTAEGRLETKRVWYLVYSVTNTGERLGAKIDASVESNVSQTLIDETGKEKVFEHPLNNLSGVYAPDPKVFKAGDEDGAITFVPRFVFVSTGIRDRLVYQRKSASDLFYGKNTGSFDGVYYDSFMPIAFAKIAKKEARNGQEFLDSTRISNIKILPGQTVWGIATWTDVDPRIDKFSIYVSGLTNSLRWELADEADSDQVGAGRDIMRKVLKVNFYNPGDEAHSGGKEIYNNLPGELDYEWIYL